MTEATRVEILAISYFGAHDLPELLASLLQQDHADWRLTVVDNSVDSGQAQVIEALIRSDDRARLLRLDTNEGYFGGARAGLEAIDVASAAAVIVSNADIRLGEPSTLSKLLEVSARAEQVALLAPRITSLKSGLDQNPHLLERPTVRQQAIRRRRMSNPALAQVTLLGSLAKRSINRRAPEATPAGTDIYAPHGSFLIFLPEYFQRGGDFGHPIFLFGEELTVAERARELGLRVVYRPEVYVEHVEHGQMGFMRSRRVLAEMGKAAAYGHELISRGDS